MKSKDSLFRKIGNVTFVRAIRRGLVSIIPVLMTGSFALILKSLPVPVYQSFITSAMSGALFLFFDLIYKATFGMMSVYMSFSVGFAMARETKYKCTNITGAGIAAVIAFLLSVSFLGDGFELNSLSAVGMFSAIICGVCGSALYVAVSRVSDTLRVFSDGADSGFNRAVVAILPIISAASVFALLNTIISVTTPFSNLWSLLEGLFSMMFNNIGGNFFGAFLYVLLSSVLWFFGIHGSDVLESVNLNIFEPAIGLNSAAVAAGNAPTEIYTKAFFDVFVLIGGCGTLLSLLIAVLLFSKRKCNRSIAKMAAFPMLFNINELMVFGLPIIYNPIMLVPFVLTPTCSFLIAASAMKLGIVPLTIVDVEWTTPVILGGLEATGSVAGAILQIVILAVGVLIYMPFVKLYDKEKQSEALSNMDMLVGVLKESEKTLAPVVLTDLTGVAGDISKQLANDLRRAIPGGELSMYYQPQFDYDGGLIGAEALLRWNHPVFGMVYPPLVLKIATEAGMLDELERHIFSMVRDDCSCIDRDIKISINTTAVSARSDDFIDYISEVFPAARVGGASVCIEVTEQSELISDKNIDQRMKKLKERGFKLAIDDFSMGFTSLKYLSENKFDIVKLDGSLVKGMDNPRNRDIIKSIVYLSESLGFSVLAEYVETGEQRDMLAQIGCKQYQGYLYSPAISADEFMKYIKGH